MSKVDIGVGDEFPLDEPGSHPGRGHLWHHHGHFHRHRRHYGLSRLATLLVLAGVIGLIVEHQFTAAIGYGLIGAGTLLIVLTAVPRAILHWRFYSRLDRQAP